jgi:hypothetical protein
MSVYAGGLGADKWAIDGRRGVWGTFRGPSDVQQPMVTVHFANGVRGAILEISIQIFHLVSPFTMGAVLKLWEEERLARVETPPHGGQFLLACNLEDAWKTHQIQSGPACLEYEAVWGDE